MDKRADRINRVERVSDALFIELRKMFPGMRMKIFSFGARGTTQSEVLNIVFSEHVISQENMESILKKYCSGSLGNETKGTLTVHSIHAMGMTNGEWANAA